MNQLIYRHSLSRSAELLDLYDMQMDAVVPIECTRPTFTTETHPCHEDQTMTITDWRQLETTMTMPPIWLDQKHHELVLAHEQLCPELATFLRSLGDPERRKVFVYHTRVSNFISIDQFRGGLQEYLAAAYLNNMASPSVSHVIVGIGFSIFEVAVYEHDESDEPEDVVRARLLNESKKSRGEALDERVRLSYFDSVTNKTETGLTVLDLSRLREDFNRVPLPNAAQLPEHPEHSQMLELMPIEQFLGNARSQMHLFEGPIQQRDMQEAKLNDSALYAMRKWRVLGRHLLALTNELECLTPRQFEVSQEAIVEKKRLDELWSCLPLCSQFGVGLLASKLQLDAPEPPDKYILVFNRGNYDKSKIIEWSLTDIIDTCLNAGFFICSFEYFKSCIVGKESEFTKSTDDAAFILMHAEREYLLIHRVKKMSTRSNRNNTSFSRSDWNESSSSSMHLERDTGQKPSIEPTTDQDARALKPFDEDLNALQVDAEQKHVELKHTLNLLLFGDTSVGESNLLKLLVNLVAFDSFDAAFKGEIKCLRSNESAKLDQNNNEEVPADQEAFSCEFRVNDKLHFLNIIDMSRLNNNERVVERIKQLDGRTALCFLLKPNQSGLPSEALDRLKEVLTILKDGTAPQICFCYVNSNEEMDVQNEGSTTSDAMSLVSQMAKESGMEISCEASNSFCFDEKLFDFLSVKESNHLEESLVDAFRQSWQQNAACLVNLIAHAAN